MHLTRIQAERLTPISKGDGFLEKPKTVLECVNAPGCLCNSSNKIKHFLKPGKKGDGWDETGTLRQ